MNQRLVIFFILIGSYLGFYLAFPLFPTIFLNSSYDFLPKETPMAARSILLGLTYTIYYLGGFIGVPLMGKLSDAFGKKSILSITLLLVSLMYILSGLALHFSSLAFLLFARFFTGFFDSSYTLLYTILISLGKNEAKKSHNLEFWVTFLSNAGWIIGSFIGWNLIAKTAVSETFFSLSFWFASLIYFSCFLLAFFLFQEKDKKSTSRIVFDENPLLSAVTSFKNQTLRPVLISNTAFYAATFIFSSYIPIFLMKEHHFGPQSLATAESYLSFSYCLAPFTYFFYSKFCSRKSTVCISAFGTTISLLLLTLSPDKHFLWALLALTSYFNALGYSFSTFLVTDYSPSERHGEVLGTNQALFILIEAIISFLLGIFTAISLYLPLVVAILSSLFSALWVFKTLLQPSIKKLTPLPTS